MFEMAILAALVASLLCLMGNALLENRNLQKVLHERDDTISEMGSALDKANDLRIRLEAQIEKRDMDIDKLVKSYVAEMKRREALETELAASPKRKKA